MKFLNAALLLVASQQLSTSTTMAFHIVQPQLSNNKVVSSTRPSLAAVNRQGGDRDQCWILQSTSTSDMETTTKTEAETKIEDLESGDNEENIGDDKEGQASLTFGGKIEKRTNELPNVPMDKLIEFFKMPENRNLLVSAGGKLSCEAIELTPELLKTWNDVCKVAGVVPPDETSGSDVVLSVKTGGIKFPGLTLTSKVIVGMKLVESPQLEYQTVLLDDEQSVTGLAPVVWVFNKLTGGPDAEKNLPDSATIVSYEQTENGEYVFKCNVDMSVTIKFPKVLMKIIPSGKEKAEENGSKAIVKTIEKDVTASMEAFEKAYLEWVK